jgi:hypothetical protein
MNKGYTPAGTKPIHNTFMSKMTLTLYDFSKTKTYSKGQRRIQNEEKEQLITSIIQ